MMSGPDSASSHTVLEVFYSYSHKDEELRNELDKHLAILRRQELISGWHDRRIAAGNEWAGEIDEHLNSAQIILLLISADFLASDYCYDLEMTRAMERHASREACVIPIILREADWSSAPFSRLRALPTDGRAVTRWPDRDEAFKNVAVGIRKAVQEYSTKKVPVPSGSITNTRSFAAKWPSRHPDWKIWVGLALLLIAVVGILGWAIRFDRSLVRLPSSSQQVIALKGGGRLTVSPEGNSVRIEAHGMRIDFNADASAVNVSDETISLSPEVQQGIANEVKRTKLEQGQKTNHSGAQGSSNPITNDVPPALDPARRTFVVNDPLDLVAEGRECSLTPGDVITRTTDVPDPDNKVAVIVASSKEGDCQPGKLIAVSVDDLQKMYNHFREQLDAGLAVLAQKHGDQNSRQ